MGITLNLTSTVLSVLTVSTINQQQNDNTVNNAPTKIN